MPVGTALPGSRQIPSGSTSSIATSKVLYDLMQEIGVSDVWDPGPWLVKRSGSSSKRCAVKRALLAAAVVLGVSSPTWAMTGNELREYCTTRWDLCHGFIVGAAWMFRFEMQSVNPICFGDGVTWDQVHDVVMNYLKDHPEVGQEHAIVVITWAIREAFDCPTTQERSLENQKNN